MPEWIVFDAVGTLIRTRQRVSDMYHRYGELFGSTQSVDEVRRRFPAAFERAFPDEEAEDEDHFRSDESIELERWRQIVAAVFDDVAPIDPCFDAIYREFAEPAAWELFPDVAANLNRLQEEGYRVAIASNFDARLYAVCAGLPPLDSISPCLISSEIGFRKPSVKFFERAAAILGCPPNQLVMVGDSSRNDVEAARRAGWHALWLHRGGIQTTPDRMIRSLDEIHDRLRAGNFV